MFVQYLNERQQGALLHYAHEMMRADSAVAGEELALLDLLRDQAEPGVEAEDVPLQDLAALFDDRLTRVAFLLEVVGMGYANEDFGPAESQLARSLSDALELGEDDTLEDVKSWVKRQLLLVREAKQLMEG